MIHDQREMEQLHDKEQFKKWGEEDVLKAEEHRQKQFSEKRKHQALLRHTLAEQIVEKDGLRSLPLQIKVTHLMRSPRHSSSPPVRIMIETVRNTFRSGHLMQHPFLAAIISSHFNEVISPRVLVFSSSSSHHF